MKLTDTKTKRTAALSLIAAAILAGPLLTPPAQAQDRRGMYDRDREREHERARFQTQHWAWDSRFNHNHYYPRVGYAVAGLPSGHHVAQHYQGGRFFFHSGVWFRFDRGRYLVVRPPVGLIIPALPVGYTQIWAGNAPYYYANDVYYTQSSQGYAVADVPVDANWQQQAPQPQAQYPAVQPQYPATQPQPQYPTASQPQYSAQGNAGNSGQLTSGTWYYCDSARGYYPHVQTCNEPWRPVPGAVPPR
jgi:hypothetical protein